MRRSTVRDWVARLSLLLIACSSHPLAPEVFALAQPTDPSRVRIVIPEVY